MRNINNSGWGYTNSIKVLELLRGKRLKSIIKKYKMLVGVTMTTGAVARNHGIDLSVHSFFLNQDFIAKKTKERFWIVMEEYLLCQQRH